MDDETPVPRLLESPNTFQEQELLRVEVRNIALRLTEVERRIAAIEELIGDGNLAAVLKQWRRLRRYLKAWILEENTG